MAETLYGRRGMLGNPRVGVPGGAVQFSQLASELGKIGWPRCLVKPKLMPRMDYSNGVPPDIRPWWFPHRPCWCSGRVLLTCGST